MYEISIPYSTETFIAIKNTFTKLLILEYRENTTPFQFFSHVIKVVVGIVSLI